jgi:trehalose monomycolate/heme transporter
VMKLLGDDCWWAPLWMKRLQTRLGLGEINLPDERKRPAGRARPLRPADRRGDRSAAARGPATGKPRTPPEPTRPSAPTALGSRAGARPEQRQPAPDAPSAAGTTRMRSAESAGLREPTWEPVTTRFSAQQNAAPNPARERLPKTSAAAPPGLRRPGHQEGPLTHKEDRETDFEAWISELRGPKANDRSSDPRGTSNAEPLSKPPTDNAARPTSVPKERPGQPTATEDDSTTAIPTSPRNTNDPDIATEKLNARGRQRRGGGLSAQDLLRREGRF